MLSPPVCSLEAVAVSVAMAHRTLLDAASAQFRAGEVTAILGPNGAGKSTLMSVLTGQRQPGQGRVDMNGGHLKDVPPGELARMRAFVAQETQVAFDFTVREVVDLGRYPHRRQASAQEASIAVLAMQATRVEHLADRALNTLSGGEKARVHLARALAQVWEPVEQSGGLVFPPGRPKEKCAPSGGREPHAVGERGGLVSPPGRPKEKCAPEGLEPAASNPLERIWTGDRGEASREPRPARPREPHAVGERGGHLPRWLLLDEPTAALDLQHQHRMLQLARTWASTQGVGVVAVLHDLNLALRYSDRCVVLQDGQVVASGVSDQVLTPQCIADVWGVAAHPVRTQGAAPGLLQYLFEAP